jgi:NTE family protein
MPARYTAHRGARWAWPCNQSPFSSSQRLVADVARYRDTLDLRVLTPLCPLTVSPVDFSHTAELIKRAHASAAAWLDNDGPRPDQAASLAPHRHASAETVSR